MKSELGPNPFWRWLGCALAACLVSTSLSCSAAELPRLKVSENGRFLVTDSGEPFFWLGDTAWELFHRLDREDAGRYLENRARKGFTVVQAVVLAELAGLADPNPYGQLPLIDNDPTKPNEDYFKHVDWIVTRANALGIVSWPHATAVAPMPWFMRRWAARSKSAWMRFREVR